MTLSEYLRARKLTLDPVEVDLNTISMEDKVKIAEVNTHCLTLLVQSRINAIGYKLLNECIPEEVTVLREAIVELATILSDHHAIQEDVKRHNESKPEEQPQTSPPIEEGKEGSL
jgi:hypothetical protein